MLLLSLLFVRIVCAVFTFLCLQTVFTSVKVAE